MTQRTKNKDTFSLFLLSPVIWTKAVDDEASIPRFSPALDQPTLIFSFFFPYCATQKRISHLLLHMGIIPRWNKPNRLKNMNGCRLIPTV